MAIRGIPREMNKHGLRVPRLVIHDNGAIETPFHIAPQAAAPTGTGVEGDIYWVDGDNAPSYYDGSAQQIVPGLARTNTFSAANTFSSTLAVTGAATLKRPIVLATTANTALTSAQSGSFVELDIAAGTAVVLPAVATADIGTWFEFYVKTTITGTTTITAATADLLHGAVAIQDFDTANTISYFAADASDDLIFTMNGGTKGGKKGSFVRFVATSATSWSVTGNLFGDGALATPFS